MTEEATASLARYRALSSCPRRPGGFLSRTAWWPSAVRDVIGQLSSPTWLPANDNVQPLLLMANGSRPRSRPRPREKARGLQENRLLQGARAGYASSRGCHPCTAQGKCRQTTAAASQIRRGCASCAFRFFSRALHASHSHQLARGLAGTVACKAAPILPHPNAIQRPANSGGGVPTRRRGLAGARHAGAYRLAPALWRGMMPTP